MILKIGIIGYGKVGKLRHNIINKLKNAKVVAIFDPNIKKKQGSIFKKNVNEIFNDKEIQAIFIATPNYLNFQYTLESVKNAKHVFCEKPPVLNSKQLEIIIKAERKYNTKIMYGFNHRHHESIKMMKKLINSKKYGKILWMRGRYGKSVDKNFFNNWRSDINKSGGGILMDQGIHMLDLLIFFAGGFDVIKSIVSNSYWKLKIEDNVFAIFKNSKNKISASLHSTITQWRHLFSLEIFLEKGYLVLNGLKTSSNSYGKEELTIAFNRTPLPQAVSLKEKKIKYTTDKSFVTETKIFIESVINNKEIKTCNTKEALNLIKVLEKIYAGK